MTQALYSEPDGYVDMRLRDLIAGAIVVACFALAALVTCLWRPVIKHNMPRLRTTLMRLGKHNR
jgi:hypothetical protein